GRAFMGRTVERLFGLGAGQGGAVRAVGQRLEDERPGAVGAPAVVAVVDGLPGTEAARQIAPRSARTQHPQAAVEHETVVRGRPAGQTGLRWTKQRAESMPLGVAQRETSRFHGMYACVGRERYPRYYTHARGRSARPNRLSAKVVSVVSKRGGGDGVGTD